MAEADDGWSRSPASLSSAKPGRRGIYTPRPARVRADAGGVPRAVGGSPVAGVREQWLVEDRWWTPDPLSRRYFELVLADGRDVVVFCEPAAGGEWFEQRA